MLDCVENHPRAAMLWQQVIDTVNLQHPRLFCERLLMHKHIWDEGCANSLTAPMPESKYHVVRSSEGHCTLQESELGQVPPQVRARAPSANPMLWVSS